jgi:hypothetical protein
LDRSGCVTEPVGEGSQMKPQTILMQQNEEGVYEAVGIGWTAQEQEDEAKRRDAQTILREQYARDLRAYLQARMYIHGAGRGGRR